MGLPVVFLLDFLVLFTSLSLCAPLPGSATVATVCWSGLLWPLPTLLAIVAVRRQHQRLLTGRRGGLHPRWLLRASTLASPAVLHLVAVPGGWLDMVWQWASGSHLATLGLLALPLAAIELPRLCVATIGHAWLEGDAGHLPPAVTLPLPGFAELWPAIRMRLSWPLLLPLPCLLLGVGLDLLQLDRELHEFGLGTTVGATLGMMLLLATFGMVLPFWFRVAFGIERTLPEPTGSVLRATASRLGFPPARVLLLPTGGRAMNAMMVGPLPFGRFLCLTDGLLQALDDELLTGVVAHEVGHARMGHPGLLLLLAGVVPLLLMSPLMSLEHAFPAVSWQALLLLLLGVFTWSIVRALAHRFEHEADIASVRALGAGPCSRALLAVVGAAAPTRSGWFGRLGSLHPEERTRCAVMLRYESEPAFRQRFDAVGRRIRLAILGAVAASAVLAGISWSADWRYEQVIWRWNVGDVVGARQLDAAIGSEVPERWQRTWKLLREELAAAATIAPDATAWEAARARFDAAWPRGVEVLLANGPAAARPWFAIAAEAGGPDRILRHLLFAFCRAAADADTEQMDQVRAILQWRGVPAELEPVFRD